MLRRLGPNTASSSEKRIGIRGSPCEALTYLSNFVRSCRPKIRTRLIFISHEVVRTVIQFCFSQIVGDNVHRNSERPTYGHAARTVGVAAIAWIRKVGFGHAEFYVMLKFVGLQIWSARNDTCLAASCLSRCLHPRSASVRFTKRRLPLSLRKRCRKEDQVGICRPDSTAPLLDNCNCIRRGPSNLYGCPPMTILLSPYVDVARSSGQSTRRTTLLENDLHPSNRSFRPGSSPNPNDSIRIPALRKY
jgi:hypothetical protein